VLERYGGRERNLREGTYKEGEGIEEVGGPSRREIE